jgi:hypothetical protein
MFGIFEHLKELRFFGLIADQRPPAFMERDAGTSSFRGAVFHDPLGTTPPPRAFMARMLEVDERLEALELLSFAAFTSGSPSAVLEPLRPWTGHNAQKPQVDGGGLFLSTWRGCETVTTKEP